MSSQNPTNPLDETAVPVQNARSKRNRAVGAIIGVGIIAALGLTAYGSTGAAFNDQKTARVDINTASLVLGVSDEDNSGTIALDFNNMKPGQLVSKSFTVANNGTIAATANLGSAFTNATSPTNPAVTYENLRIGVGTATGQTPLVAVTKLPANGWDLGVLQPGESKTFVVDVKLGGDAGNEWKGQTFGGNLPVTLTQQ